MIAASWTVSIVSHNHGRQTLDTLEALHQQLKGRSHRLILTLNVPEDDAFLAEASSGLAEHLAIRRNRRPAGFAANHNAALCEATSDFVLVADPCLRLPEPIFDALAAHLSLPQSGIASPQALDPDGQPEDNGRELVSPKSLLNHYLLRHNRRPSHNEKAIREVTWLAGLFLAMRRETFTALNGFDTRYFLYCEDVDLCLRARQQGLRVELMPNIRVTHAANRDTRRKWRHLLWHIRSLLRLWRSKPYRAAKRMRQ